ncbi:hypothetical protein [Streptomyces lomondensis]|uniref:Transposase n=1 Tax=Streptomyces lomondensis TaxID=68229 RepID=A0ABQ2XAV9_9ACTN|nr:hypothetical protein [Streptomyces lomondensis]MCF0076985.1 transposase [Streptomyces lomondensis]GGX07520.1 hypothetical protein GCM10010383_42160 [Streptomyces lomondensis]
MSVKRAVLAIEDTAWQQITYPTAVPDPDTGELISEQVTARLIVRRARRLTLHLPSNWPWQHAWTHVFDTVHRPPEAS